LTRCPLNVSPFLSSTSIGLFWAAVSSDSGSIVVGDEGAVRSILLEVGVCNENSSCVGGSAIYLRP